MLKNADACGRTKEDYIMKAVNRFLRTLLLMSVLLICCGATHALADDPPVTITQPKAWSAWSYDDTITARW